MLEPHPPSCVGRMRFSSEDGVEQGPDQNILDEVVEDLVEGLDAFADETDAVRTPEYMVQHTDILVVHVLGRCRLDQMIDGETVDRGHDAALERAFDVTEQNEAGLIGLVFGEVNVRFVEYDAFAVAPKVVLAVHDD